MEILKERILKDGMGIGTEILKVDSFLNHQLDIGLLNAIGQEFFTLFSDVKVTKILTIEASGIAIASIAAQYFKVPVVFAKKAEPNTMVDGFYEADIHSFTKNKDYIARVSKKFLGEQDHILIIDDFLAKGCALKGLVDIVAQSGATLAGCGIVIEKAFQGGGQALRNQGIRIESLAVIKSIKDHNINFY